MALSRLLRTQTHIDSKILQKNSYHFLERLSFIKQVFLKSLLSSTSAMFVCQATEFHFRRDFHLRRGVVHLAVVPSSWWLCRRVGGCAVELVVVPPSWWLRCRVGGCAVELVVVPSSWWLCRRVGGCAVDLVVVPSSWRLCLDFGSCLCRRVGGCAVASAVVPWHFWATVEMSTCNILG